MNERLSGPFQLAGQRSVGRYLRARSPPLCQSIRGGSLGVSQQDAPPQYAARGGLASDDPCATGDISAKGIGRNSGIFFGLRRPTGCSVNIEEKQLTTFGPS